MSRNSLRYTLQQRLLLSVNVAILLLLPVIYWVFQSYATEAYDQELAESTLSLVSYLHTDATPPWFRLPLDAEQVFRSDQYDQNFYLVLGPGRKYMAGDEEVLSAVAPQALAIKPAQHVFYDAEFGAQRIRVCAFRHEVGGREFLLFAAETTHKRDRLSLKILLGLILPLFVLAVVNAIAIWHGVRFALKPVEDIRLAIQNMQHGNLTPLREEQAPSELRPLVQEFNALLHRLNEAAVAQQQFVANAAHQLRTPLAGVRTQLEFIAGDTQDQALQARLAQCVEAISRLSHLVTQMLTLLSATPTAQGATKADLIDVPYIVHERFAEWLPIAKSRNIDLGCELEPMLVPGNPLLLGEAIANLVANALAYVPNGGMVTIRCRQEGERGILEVEDNGPGIPPAERKLVFERFYRLPQSGSSGSGLGLAIVREVVAGLGGEVSIQTPASGIGCLVRIELPL